MNYWTSCIVLKDNVIILAMISLAGLIQGAAVSWHGKVHVGRPLLALLDIDHPSMVLLETTSCHAVDWLGRLAPYLLTFHVMIIISIVQHFDGGMSSPCHHSSGAIFRGSGS